MIQEIKRDIVVSPRKQIVGRIVAHVHSGFGDLDFEKKDETGDAADANNEWEKLADKYEELEEKANEYLNDEQNLGTRKPPIVPAPPKMTREAWERPQATHAIPTQL